jgi:hypothetical protein
LNSLADSHTVGGNHFVIVPTARKRLTLEKGVTKSPQTPIQQGFAENLEKEICREFGAVFNAFDSFVWLINTHSNRLLFCTSLFAPFRMCEI